MFDTGEEGVEPPLTVLETALLPLEDSPVCRSKADDFVIIAHSGMGVNEELTKTSIAIAGIPCIIVSAPTRSGGAINGFIHIYCAKGRQYVYL